MEELIKPILSVWIHPWSMWAFSPVDLCGGQKTSTFSHDLNLNCVETKTKHCTIKKNWHGNYFRKRGSKTRYCQWLRLKSFTKFALKCLAADKPKTHPHDLSLGCQLQTPVAVNCTYYFIRNLINDNPVTMYNLSLEKCQTVKYHLLSDFTCPVL